MTTRITIFSRKGGVGKTTTAVALAQALAQLEPTLLVDCDAQGQCTLHLGLPVLAGMAHWLLDKLPLGGCLYPARPDLLTLLPSDSTTAVAQKLVSDLPTKLRQLAFTPFTVFDTGGTGGLLQEAALVVADQVVLPFRPEVPGIDGLYASLEVVKVLNPHAQLTLLPVCFDKRLREHRDNLAHLPPAFALDYGAEELYAIRQRIAVAEAVSQGETIWEYNGQGINDVRIGYAYLAGRVLRLAGRDGTQFEQLEAIAHGKA